MFTGIIEETGAVRGIRTGESSIELKIQMRRCGKGTQVGDSLAINGCCLTVARIRRFTRHHLATFDLLKETWDRTSFSELAAGSTVNLERALRAGDRFGGHFVTGHIDGVGTIRRWEAVGADYRLEIKAPRIVQRLIIPKGSIAVEGISLTVAEVMRSGFAIWIIPHTRRVTALKDRKVGDTVNLEADLLGKYVEKFTRRS